MTNLPHANNDEANVPPYTLPNPLITDAGVPVADVAAWRERRAEILTHFAIAVYGRTPAVAPRMQWSVHSHEAHALDGSAERREVRLSFPDVVDGPAMNLLIYLPHNRRGSVPLFLGLNFLGNHTIDADRGITLAEAWMPDRPQIGYVAHRATDASRGVDAESWQVPMILARGYGLATLYYGDLDPDFDDGFQNGVHPLFYQPGQQRPAADQWGAIGAWAWGLSRVLDYLETDPAIDARRVALIGHSRLGKAALWAGAQDERFALVISNNSGCGGAALLRRILRGRETRIKKKKDPRVCG